MKWSIVLVVLAGVSFIMGMVARILVYWGTVTFLGIRPASYLLFTNTLLLFAIAIAILVKFQKS